MRRSLVTLLVTAAAALGAVGTPAAAPPNLTAAETLCTSVGGSFFGTAGSSYGCSRFPGFTFSETRRAANLCEHAYGGLFLLLPPGAILYVCAVT
jgi:hypothetical protein